MKRINVFLLTLCLLLTMLSANVLADTAAASTIRLAKTEGTVDVKDPAGKSAFLQTDMRLVSGNRTLTAERSYAWFSLDDAKALKEDAVSETEIRRSGSRLEVLLHSGNLFFNVREPLQSGETMNIRTSSMVMGIRGTSGWVKVLDSRTTRVFMLDGTALCSVTNPITGQTKSILLRAGETADFVVYDPNRPVDQCDIILRRFTREEIEGFVLMELLGDDPTILKILQDSGIDLRSLTEDEARSRLLADQETLAPLLEIIHSSLSSQENHISQDPVWDRQPVPEVKEAAPVPTPEGPVRTLTMPVTAQEVQDLLNDPNVTQVILQPGSGDNTLNIDIPFTVPAGKTLTTNAGVPVDVNSEYSMNVNGTADLGDALTNNGTTNVNSSNTLKVTGVITNNAAFNNTASGRTQASGGFHGTAGSVFTNNGSFAGNVTVNAGTFTMNAGTVNGTVTLTGDAALYMNGGEITWNGSGPTLTLSIDDLGNFNTNGGTIANTGTGPAADYSGALSGVLTDPGSTTFRAASYIDIVSPAIFLYTGVPDSGSYVLSEDWNHQFPVTTDSRFGYDLDDIAQTILVNGVSSGTAKKGDSVEFRFTNNGLHDRIYSYEFDCEDLENGTLNIPVGETRSITVTMPWDTVGLSFTDETVYTCSYTESDEDFFTITADGEDIRTSKKVRRGQTVEVTFTNPDAGAGGYLIYAYPQISGEALPGAWASGILRSGDTLSFSFEMTGDDVHFSIHSCQIYTLPAGDLSTLESAFDSGPIYLGAETSDVLAMDSDFNVPAWSEMIIAEGVTVNVKNGATLRNEGTLYNLGTINVEEGGTLDNTGSLYNFSDHTVNNAGTITNSPKGVIHNGDGVMEGTFRNISGENGTGFILNRGEMVNHDGSSFTNEGIILAQGSKAISPKLDEGSVPVVRRTMGGPCGRDLWWALTEDEESGADKAYVLHFIGSGPMQDYSVKDGHTTAPWYRDGKISITRIRMEADITSIGKNALYGLDSLEEVIFAGSQSRWGRLKTGSGNDILEDVRITCLGGAEDLPEPEETLENDLAGRTSVKKEETANTAAKPVPETPPAQEDETLPAATPSQLAKPEEKATSSQLARRDNPES